MKQNFTMIKTIATIQVAGGIHGVLLFYFAMGNTVVNTLMLLVLSLYSLSIYSGLELWRMNKRGYLLSIINLSLQVVFLSGSFFTFQYTSGLHWYVGHYNNLIMNIHLGSECFIYVYTSDISTGFAVNLIPLIFLIYISLKKELFSGNSITSVTSSIDVLFGDSGDKSKSDYIDELNESPDK